MFVFFQTTVTSNVMKSRIRDFPLLAIVVKDFAYVDTGIYFILFLSSFFGGQIYKTHIGTEYVFSPYVCCDY